MGALRSRIPSQDNLPNFTPTYIKPRTAEIFGYAQTRSKF